MIVKNFQKQNTKREIIIFEDITDAVKEETKRMQNLINSLGKGKAKKAVEPNDVFGAIKASKERLDKWIFAEEEKLWVHELRALLRGAPVKVKELQRLSMACGSARFSFIKEAQKVSERTEKKLYETN